MVNQILRLQETALSSKPKVAMVADKLSRYFVVAVLTISALTYAFWAFQGNEHAFWITISVLVATCPCALGLATPSALTCAMARLNKQGILLKRADALEQLTEVSDIVFDKTGTLTHGEFTIEKTWFVNNDKASSEKYRSIAKSIELQSEHPIALAFDSLETHSDLVAVQDLKVMIGKGLSCNVGDNSYRIGSPRYIMEGAQAESVSGQLTKNIQGANVLLSENDKLVAAFWLRDKLKEDVVDIVQALATYEQTILSGDTLENVTYVANSLGIKNKVAEQAPEQKLSHIKALQTEGRSVLMLGDGINDAPVLAASDVSVAVGNASDLAKNAADVILLNPDLASLLHVISMAKRTKNKIKQNIAWALSYNILVLPFAIGGYLTPWMAALGMSISSIIVVYNSTRLMRNS